MCECATAIGLRRGIAYRVAELEAELAQAILDGDEWTAALLRDDIGAAKTLARLIHKCESPIR